MAEPQGELRLPDVQPLAPGTQMPPSESLGDFASSVTGPMDAEGQPGFGSGPEDDDDLADSPARAASSSPTSGSSPKRPVWLQQMGEAPAFALPSASGLLRKSEMVEEKLQAIRSKLRASSFFNGMEDWERVFKRADKDGNGDLDPQELIKLIAGTIKGGVKDFEVDERDMRQLFRFLDVDGDGTISFAEFAKFLEGRINFRVTQAEQDQIMADMRKQRLARRSHFQKSKELEKIEARRKRHGYADPSRPYGWEDVEYTSIPQATRDLANKGTLRDRRRRPRPVNPYYDSKHNPAPMKEEWRGSEQPEIFRERSDGALTRGRPAVRLCARKRRGTPTALPHSLMGHDDRPLRHWGKGSMCMMQSRDTRPKKGERRERPSQYFSGEKNLNFVQQLEKKDQSIALVEKPVFWTVLDPPTDGSAGGS